MVDYTIRAVDMDTFRVCNYPFEVEPYQPYSFEPVSFLDNEGNRPAAGYVWVGEDKHYVIHPHLNGFVVKKVYAEDTNETDPVLRAWGVYDHINLWEMEDNRFQKWLEKQILNLLGGESHLTCKIRYRLTAFAPRRSEKFHPKISVWQSLENRDNDRATAMKPARALALMFPELDHNTLNEVTDKYLQKFVSRELKLHVSQDPKDFALAYSGEQSVSENMQTTYARKHMAHSCMRYSFDHLPQHPAEAYASGDFKIIYVLDQEGLVCSRCVVAVHEETPQPSPIYGVTEQAIDLIDAHLKTMGACSVGNSDWSGAKLSRIPYPDGDGFVAPYLDISPQSLHDDGTHLVVDNYGEIDASCYSGVLGGHQHTCYCCEGGLNEDESYFSEWTEEYYCESCYYEEHIYCEYAGEDVHRDHTTTAYIMGRSGHKYREMVATSVIEYGDEFIYCESDGEYWHCDNVTYVESEDIYVDPINLEAHYFECDWLCEWYHNDEM